MNRYLNAMILNGIDIGISRIELDKTDLLITDKSHKFCFKACVRYNWKEINNLKVEEKKSIDFNEYYLSKNNEAVLICPSTSYVVKPNNNSIYLYLKFENLSKDQNTCYMNKSGCFDIEIDSLEIKVLIDYKDVNGNSVIYEF